LRFHSRRPSGTRRLLAIQRNEAFSKVFRLLKLAQMRPIYNSIGRAHTSNRAMALALRPSLE